MLHDYKGLGGKIANGRSLHPLPPMIVLNGLVRCMFFCYQRGIELGLWVKGWPGFVAGFVAGSYSTA